MQGPESNPRTHKNIAEFKTRLENLIEWDDSERLIERDDLMEWIKRNEPGALIKLEDVKKLAKPTYSERPKGSRLSISINYEGPSERSQINHVPKKMTSDQQRALVRTFSDLRKSY